MNRYNKISPDVRKELESKLAARFTKTSKTGMAKRLLKGEDVENHLTKTFKEHSDKTTKDIDKKTQDAIVSINQRIDAVLKYMQSVVQAKVDGIRVPEDGRTPSADEIKALLSPMVDETRTQFTQRISKIEDLLTKAPKESDVPTDLKGLEAFVKSKIPKLGGGGGGASYLFELFDTPAKSKSRQGAYVGYEGLVLAVSNDGKSLVFKAGGTGGGHTIEDEGTPLTTRTKLNFVGAGVTVTDDAGDDATVVTIPGGSAGSGDVVGPASAVNNNFAAFDTTTGKLIKDSGSKASDFATAAQGTLAASAQQPPSEGAFVNGDKTKLDTYSEANQTANNAKVTNATHTGDVTGATALTIAANAVTNAKAAQMATKTYKGRTTAGTGNSEDVPVATLKTDLVLVKADVGLANVDNTADTAKPVSTAQQTALNLKANLASPSLTGTPTAPTQTAGNNSTRIATTAFATTALNLKANLASPTFTGTPTLPTGTIATTQSAGNNTTAIATTAFATTALNLKANIRGAVNAQTGTTYTLVIGDEYLDGVRQTNAAANTITIPPNADVAFPVGSTKILIIQGGAGSTTIAAGAGVTLSAPASVTAAIGEINGSRVIQKVGVNEWLLI